jgi:hypothetical protein
MEWYLIHSEWLRDWKMFVNNKRTSNVYGSRKSKIKEVGILDPGPITNYMLMDENNQPKEGLQKSKHYRGINREVWQQFYNTYGGGPVLRRPELNIYAEDDKNRESADMIEHIKEKDVPDTPLEEESQPIVSNEFDDIAQNVGVLMMNKNKGIFSIRRGDHSNEPKSRIIAKPRFGSKSRDSDKTSSISRSKTGIFKQGLNNSRGSGDISPFNSGAKKGGLRSFIESREQSAEKNVRYFTNNLKKEKPGKKIN